MMKWKSLVRHVAVRHVAVRRLLALLAFLAVGIGCGEPVPEGPPPGVDVRHYDVALRLDPATQELQARALLDVSLSETLDALPLDFAGMTLDAVRVDGRVVEVERRRGRLHVPLPPGRDVARLAFVYHGRPVTGLYAAAYGTQQVVFTDSWPDAGKGWLPGDHHPADPATFALTLTLPRGYEAVASGVLRTLDTLGASVRYRWRLDVPVPSYAFAFAVADFSVTEAAIGDTLPVRYHLLAEDSARAALLARTPEALAFLAGLIGPYPFAQYASVQVPLGYAGMENASAAFLRADLFQDGSVEDVQIHELAHQWFGNRVSLAAWHDLWLSEGMSTYLSSCFYEHADGRDAARRRWVDLAALSPARRRTHTALVPSEPVEPEALLTWVAYDKGASVLHLLRRTLGDDAFFGALRATYKQYADRPLSTAAFQAILEATSRRDLSGFFAYWVYGDALPTLATAWDPSARTLTWRITGDAGTLDGVSFDLELQQGDRLRYVDAATGRAVLDRWEAVRPAVRPVGVMMRIE